MEKFIALCFGICVLNAHCAVYGNAGEHLRRQVRSPHYGGHFFFGPPPPGPPPPPPFIYHTHNWSGVSRGYGGRSNGVFSGAAAAAGSAPPASGEALALAAADASSGQNENCDDAASNSNLAQLSNKAFGTGSSQYDGQIKSAGSELSGSHSGSLQAGFSKSSSSSVAGGLAVGGSIGRGFGDSGSADFGGQLGEYKSHSSSFGSGSANSGYAGDSGKQNSGYNSQASGIGSGFPTSNGNFEGGQHYKEAHFLENQGGQFGAQQSNAGSFSQGSLSGHRQGLSEQSQFGTQHSNARAFGQRDLNGNRQSEEFDNSQSQSSSFGNAGNFGAGQGSGFQGSEYKLNGGLSSHSQAGARSQEQLSGAGSASSGYAYGQRGFSNSNYQDGHHHSQQLQSSESIGQSAGVNSGLASGGQVGLSSGANGGSHGDAHADFNAALELASQSLQTADKAGCSTCQKSSYALSNAKSYNGNAISLAIGG